MVSLIEAHRADPSRLPPRAKRDAELKPEIQRVHDENFGAYGAEKVWRQLNRENSKFARCPVERLMAKLGRYDAVCGGKKYCTTKADSASACPADLVSRQLQADRPKQLWVADFTYVATRPGLVFVAFVIDIFARRVVGWQVSRSMLAELVLDALEQALWARGDSGGLIHHSDRGSQYLAIRYTERLLEASIQCSVGTRGDSYDNALAEFIIGLLKTEVIHRRAPWKSIEPVEYATLERVDWFNYRRLLGPIANVPPAEFEQAYYDRLKESATVA